MSEKDAQVLESTPKDRFLQSLDRCTSNDDFIPAFYNRFLSSSDDIRDKFKYTDFDRQKKMLVGSLKLAAGVTAGEPESLQELNVRAIRHDQYHLNIKSEFYDIWLKCLIATAREYDKEWVESTEADWRYILGFVIKHMIKHY